ncbi:hypothetical protein JCM10213_000518 [Rhodosporidiobolus nylandii]
MSLSLASLDLADPRPPRANPFDALPDELLALVFEAALAPPPPLPHQPRCELLDTTERARCAQLSKLGCVSKRWREAADAVGEAVVRLDQAFGGIREREAPVRKLCVVVKEASKVDRALSSPSLSSNLVALTLSCATPGLPFPNEYGGPLLEHLEELTIVGTKTALVGSGWWKTFLYQAPSLRILRISGAVSLVDGPPHLPASIETLQIHPSGATSAWLERVEPKPAIRHLHTVQDTHHESPLSAGDALLGLLTPPILPFWANLTAFSFLVDDALDGSSVIFYDTFLPLALPLQHLYTAQCALNDRVLTHLPSLLHLRTLRLCRTADAPAAEHDPAHWTWHALASNVKLLLKSPERAPGGPLRVEVKVEGSMRKYDVAQKGCRQAFAAVGVERNEGRLRVTLQYWEDRPQWQAWPV